jgi:serine/threonine-protein kinase
MSFVPGQKVGDYEILGVLGAGGMGEVYKVRNVISDRLEAMKILLPDLASQQELANRFLREIKVLASMDHPNIASLRTAFYAGNQLVMIMELVEGTTLADRLKDGALPDSEALESIAPVLSALSYAHARGIVHRDIKPANMMLTKNGAIKLMDFGIAHAAGEAKLTMTGSTLGSIYYMSPEQIRGESPDARSDLYSLGVSLYELVTAQHPFEGETSFTIMKGHIDGNFKPARQVNPTVSEGVNQLILKAMAKESQQRFQSADDFAAGLQSVRPLSGTSAAAAATTFLAGGAPPAPATAAFRPASMPTAARPATSVTLPAPSVYPDAGRVAPSAASMPAGTVAQPAQTAMASVPVPPVYPEAGRAAPPPMSRGHRALYIGLGSALTLALVVLTAMRLPMFRGTAPATKPPVTAPSAGSTTPPGGLSVGGTVTPPAGAPSQQDAAGGAVLGASSQPDAAGGAAEGAPAPASKKSSGAGAKRESAQAAKQVQEAAAAAAAAKAAAEEAARLLEEQENRYTHMSARAGAMGDTFETLRRQQNAAGYGPDSSLSTAYHSMQSLLSRADAALAAGDAAAAKKFMDQAETQIEVLERRFGR